MPSHPPHPALFHPFFSSEHRDRACQRAVWPCSDILSTCSPAIAAAGAAAVAGPSSLPAPHVRHSLQLTPCLHGRRGMVLSSSFPAAHPFRNACLPLPACLPVVRPAKAAPSPACSSAHAASGGDISPHPVAPAASDHTHTLLHTSAHSQRPREHQACPRVPNTFCPSWAPLSPVTALPSKEAASFAAPLGSGMRSASRPFRGATLLSCFPATRPRAGLLSPPELVAGRAQRDLQLRWAAIGYLPLRQHAASSPARLPTWYPHHSQGSAPSSSSRVTLHPPGALPPPHPHPSAGAPTSSEP